MITSSLVFVYIAGQYLRSTAEPESILPRSGSVPPLTNPSTFDEMLEWTRAGKSWQDAMDSNEGVPL